MSDLQGYGGSSNPRLIYNLGHAAFEFIEARWGKEGVRQFVFSLRKSVIGGGENAFKEAFDIDADEWDQQFDRYLKERFKPFRDKDGRPTTADRAERKKPLQQRAVGRTLTVGRSDRERQPAGASSISCCSRQGGSVVRNLTSLFDRDLGFKSIPFQDALNTVRDVVVTAGRSAGYFVRTEGSSLLLQNVIAEDRNRIP
jgi:hypothetical protein